MWFQIVSQPCERVVLPGDLVSANVSLADVNWSRELALVVDMGEQRTGGYAVKVAAVNLIDSDQVELDVEITRPGPGQFVVQALTHPYAVCRIPRMGLRSGEVTVIARDQNGREAGRQVLEL